MFLKICGITRREDALHAVASGATAVGFVFWPQSPRWIAPEQAAAIVADLPSEVVTVGVFVNEEPDTVRTAVMASGIRCVQLHGDEDRAYADALALPVIRSVTLDAFEAAERAWAPGTTFLLDAADAVRRGGTGRTVDWERASWCAQRGRVVLAGGLTPGNVADAVARVRPYGVDVSSGVEAAAGVKDPEKVSRFLEAARHAYGAAAQETHRR
jgi:phosphoribosylanthranilate isomerase